MVKLISFLPTFCHLLVSVASAADLSSAVAQQASASDALSAAAGVPLNFQPPLSSSSDKDASRLASPRGWGASKQQQISQPGTADTQGSPSMPISSWPSSADQLPRAVPNSPDQASTPFLISSSPQPSLSQLSSPQPAKSVKSVQSSPSLPTSTSSSLPDSSPPGLSGVPSLPASSPAPPPISGKLSPPSPPQSGFIDHSGAAVEQPSAAVMSPDISKQLIDSSGSKPSGVPGGLAGAGSIGVGPSEADIAKEYEAVESSGSVGESVGSKTVKRCDGKAHPFLVMQKVLQQKGIYDEYMNNMCQSDYYAYCQSDTWKECKFVGAIKFCPKTCNVQDCSALRNHGNDPSSQPILRGETDCVDDAAFNCFALFDRGDCFVMPGAMSKNCPMICGFCQQFQDYAPYVPDQERMYWWLNNYNNGKYVNYGRLYIRKENELKTKILSKKC